MNAPLERFIPRDGFAGTLVGRVWLPERTEAQRRHPGGPAVVAFREDGVFDISRRAPTVAQLIVPSTRLSAVVLVSSMQMPAPMETVVVVLAERCRPAR